MTMKPFVFPAGTAITFTTGEYSDFCTRGTVVTLKCCDLPALVREYLVEGGRTEWESWRRKPEDFAAWLVMRGHAFPADLSEVHLGGYGEFESEMIEMEPGSDR